MPANFIYDETTALIRDCKSNLLGIAGSFQPVAAGNLPRIRTEEIGVARAKANKDRQKCDATEIVRQMLTPH